MRYKYTLLATALFCFSILNTGLNYASASAGGEQAENNKAAKNQNHSDMKEIKGRVDSLTYTTNQLSKRIDKLQESMDQYIAQQNFVKKGSDINSNPVVDEYSKVFDNLGIQLQNSKKYDDLYGATNRSDSDKSTARGIESYREAYRLLQVSSYGDKKFKEARDAFRKFIKNFPENGMVGSAYYWIAESYMYEKEYSKAAIEYLKGYESPSSERSADNILGIAKAMIKINRSNEACIAIMQFSKEFPDANVSLRSEAKKISEALMCNLEK